MHEGSASGVPLGFPGFRIGQRASDARVTRRPQNLREHGSLEVPRCARNSLRALQWWHARCSLGRAKRIHAPHVSPAEQTPDSRRPEASAGLLRCSGRGGLAVRARGAGVGRACRRLLPGHERTSRRLHARLRELVWSPSLSAELHPGGSRERRHVVGRSRHLLVRPADQCRRLAVPGLGLEARQFGIISLRRSLP
jgi:hypothetical protein